MLVRLQDIEIISQLVIRKYDFYTPYTYISAYRDALWELRPTKPKRDFSNVHT